jgi:hypothetical protein
MRDAWVGEAEGRGEEGEGVCRVGHVIFDSMYLQTRRYLSNPGNLRIFRLSSSVVDFRPSVFSAVDNLIGHCHREECQQIPREYPGNFVCDTAQSCSASSSHCSYVFISHLTCKALPNDAVIAMLELRERDEGSLVAGFFFFFFFSDCSLRP